jgi:hypothetical protein
LAFVDDNGNVLPFKPPAAPKADPGWSTPWAPPPNQPPPREAPVPPPAFEPSNPWAGPDAAPAPHYDPISPAAPAYQPPSAPAAPGPSFTPPGYSPGGVAASNAANDAWLREMARNAIIGFGDSTLAGMAGFGFDPQDAAFAKQSYLSGNATLARLDKAHDLQRKAIINRLASHGILNSGDLGYLEGEEGQQYGNQLYDARSSLLRYLTGLYSQSASSKTQTLHDLANQWLTANGGA